MRQAKEWRWQRRAQTLISRLVRGRDVTGKGTNDKGIGGAGLGATRGSSEHGKPTDTAASQRESARTGPVQSSASPVPVPSPPQRTCI